MNSSLRTVEASGKTPFSKLAAASLNETSLTLSENVENALSRVCTSACGTGGGVAGLGGGASKLRIADCGLRIAISALTRFEPRFVGAKTVAGIMLSSAHRR